MSLQAPFPYFGGKRRAAAIVWDAIGDPGGYIEPFAGSAAVLLTRPPFRGRRVETINDADGWLVNTWRAIQLAPDDVARHAVGPVTEIDYHARLAWLQQRRTPDLVAWLEGDPEAHDAKAAGWWLYVMAAGIGDPFGPGPWIILDDRLVDSRKLPHLGDAGRGVAVLMRRLSERLQRVRITCGDWRRVLTPAASRAKTGGDGSIAVFLDPPYATSGDLYAHSEDGIAQQVHEWAADAPDDLRIVLCGFDSEHDALLTLGWTKVNGRAGGGAGYNSDPTAGRRERLWMSPACRSSEQGVLL